jgi:hypothetical protein
LVAVGSALPCLCETREPRLMSDKSHDLVAVGSALPCLCETREPRLMSDKSHDLVAVHHMHSPAYVR